jgi:hypothetical protein
MKLAEFERRITDAAEALANCALEIKNNNAFEVEEWLRQAYQDLRDTSEFARKWADEQEREIAKAEESKGYEIVQ